MTMPTRQFANDDDATQHWLSLLRDGDDDQKIEAREQLAAIFERRGMYEEAANLLISNVHDGVRSADIFRWLARLYRNQGQEVLAMQAAAEASKYMQQSGSALPAETAVMTSRPVVTEPAPLAEVGPARQAGQCSVCGYLNRSQRAACKQCRAPLQVQPRAARSPLSHVMALLIAIPLSWIASIVLGMLVAIFPGVATAPRGAEIVPWIALLGWIPIAIYWVYAATSVRHVARRALMTLAVECFAMPAVGLLAGFGAGVSSAGADRSGAAALGALAAGGMMAIAMGCVGFTFGLLFLVVWLAIRKDSADR